MARKAHDAPTDTANSNAITEADVDNPLSNYGMKFTISDGTAYHGGDLPASSVEYLVLKALRHLHGNVAASKVSAFKKANPDATPDEIEDYTTEVQDDTYQAVINGTLGELSARLPSLESKMRQLATAELRKRLSKFNKGKPREQHLKWPAKGSDTIRLGGKTLTRDEAVSQFVSKNDAMLRPLAERIIEQERAARESAAEAGMDDEDLFDAPMNTEPQAA